jgi:hypothetical protein
MTPKEKAKEFMHYYLKELLSAKYSINGFVINDLAKQCALIAVDEIIAEIEPSVSMDVIEARIKYWNEVKQELEKL